MELTADQFARIAPHLPRQRGNVSHENLNVINAILFAAEKAASGWHCRSALVTGIRSTLV
jgi:hypothetical protein